ncbi:MAG: twin-arginine translocase subunit TatC [Nitrososphaerota archaeon]
MKTKKDAKKQQPVKDMREMTLMEHLAELRDRLKICLISIGVSTLIMLAFPAQILNPMELLSGIYKPLVSIILQQIVNLVKPPEMQIIGGTITAPLEIYFIASLVFGLGFSSPIVGYEVYKYIDPALYPHERRLVYPFVAAFTGLFTTGLFFGLFLISPFTFRAMIIFFDLVGALPMIAVMDFYMTILVVTVATGAIFTTPIFIIIFVRIGLISTKSIEKNRKWIYGIGYIVAAIITPDGGVFANLILLGFLIVLVESGIVIAKRYERRRAEEERLCPFCGEYMGDRIFCPHCGRSRL